MRLAARDSDVLHVAVKSSVWRCAGESYTRASHTTSDLNDAELLMCQVEERVWRSPDDIVDKLAGVVALELLRACKMKRIAGSKPISSMRSACRRPKVQRLAPTGKLVAH